MTSISSNVSIAAFVRTSLKFDPQESVALVLCNEQSVVVTIRVDLHSMGNETQWASSIGNVLGKISADHAIDATVLVAYDELGTFKGAKHDALIEVLENAGAPVQRTVLVANGKIMNYHGDGTDAVPYSEVETQPIALMGMLNGKNPLRAKDIEHCEETSAEVQDIAEARMAEMIRMGETLEEIAPKIGHEMATQIAIYCEAGEVTTEIAGWLAGTFSMKMGRDMAVLALAGTATDKEGIADFLIGDRVVEDRKILEIGHEMLFEALAYIAGRARTNILCAVAWAHWTQGNSTEAMATLTEARELEPDHKLANQFVTLIARGKVAKTSLVKPEK
ncbi:UNVERIFIED_CONTAM: DUF4192 family protein [Actinomycetes bacterium ARC8]|nr:DUF4192 family protein [Actinomycetes bacterium ARC8]